MSRPPDPLPASSPDACPVDPGRFPVLAELILEQRRTGGCQLRGWERAARDKFRAYAQRHTSKRRRAELERILAAFTATEELIAFLSGPPPVVSRRPRLAERSQCISTQVPQRSRRLTNNNSHQATPPESGR